MAGITYAAVALSVLAIGERSMSPLSVVALHELSSVCNICREYDTENKQRNDIDSRRILPRYG